ncbi:uncharacterized protein [Henckelia pumila]|uniref:uncharacterized protein isoform X4 n=1 Tax=Henckelia pumila TaxID=405737 RepID=UPI003C6E81EF
MVRGRKSAGVSGLVSDATQFLPLHGPANSCSLRYLGSVDNSCSDPFPTVAPPFAAPRRLRLPHTLGKRWFRCYIYLSRLELTIEFYIFQEFISNFRLFILGFFELLR